MNDFNKLQEDNDFFVTLSTVICKFPCTNGFSFRWGK